MNPNAVVICDVQAVQDLPIGNSERWGRIGLSSRSQNPEPSMQLPGVEIRQNPHGCSIAKAIRNSWGSLPAGGRGPLNRDRKSNRIELQGPGRRIPSPYFDGEHLTTDDGVLALQQVDQKLQIFRRFAEGFLDARKVS